MRALSVRQPWAELIASGRKTIETRTWATKYRGPILIVAGLAIDKTERAWKVGFDGFDATWDFSLTRGYAVAVADLYDIKTMAAVHEAAAMVPARPGLLAWYLRDVRRIRPFPVKGKLGLFDVEAIT